ncbi:Variant-specific surface protein, partial [Giardia duodenalis]
VNDPAGVPIDSLCRPSSSLQVSVAGCTGSDGAALTDASTACGMCSGGFFLFRGGCYSTKSTSGSEMCTKAEGGRCTTCKTDGSYIFQNRAATVTLGNECILCSDTTNRDGYKGVANCNTCTAPGSAGPATCDTCQEGYYLDNTDKTCKPCNGCATCTDANICTSCPEGKYLKMNQCVDGTSDSCGANSYADKRTWTCKACSEITGCTACACNDATGKPKCTNCNGGKKVKTALDGTTTCVDVATGCKDENHFQAESDAACYLCGENTQDQTEANKGTANCKTCTKTGSAKPECTACLDGYFFNTNDKTCTTRCADNCATCSEATNPNKCSTCMAGFFLKGTAGEGQCVPCGDTTQGGIDGCAECDSQSSTLKCTKCKPNRKPVGTEGTQVTCEEKTCEDDSACGGTAGACDAIVIGASGEMTYYCSQCADNSQYPIDGLCVDNSKKGNNQCSNGVCTSCTTGYFLDMGGCYSSTSAPGNLMCKTAEGGICTTVANSRYFAVPGATAGQQSVLACGNPVGTTTGSNNDIKAYVGIQGCKTCEAPTAPSPAGMTAAKCTACDGGKALTGSGYGCVTCSVAGCSACKADNMCEACSDGYRLEGETCVRTSTIAGISVTKSLSALCC